MKIKNYILISSLSFPSITNAAYFADVSTMTTQASSVIKALIGIAFALAMLAFFFGIARFLWNVDNAEQREQGKWVMIYSVVAIFVMVSVYGLVAFLQSAFIPQYANIQTTSSTGSNASQSPFSTQTNTSNTSGSASTPFSGGTNLNNNAWTDTLTGTSNSSQNNNSDVIVATPQSSDSIGKDSVDILNKK